MTKVYANKDHLVSLPTRHVVALLKLLDGTPAPVEGMHYEEWEAIGQAQRVLRIEAESAELDMSVRCDQCGRHTGMDTGVCGMCAEDFNTNPPAVGRKRINRRRVQNGLDPLVWEGE